MIHHDYCSIQLGPRNQVTDDVFQLPRKKSGQAEGSRLSLNAATWFDDRGGGDKYMDHK